MMIEHVRRWVLMSRAVPVLIAAIAVFSLRAGAAEIGPAEEPGGERRRAANAQEQPITLGNVDRLELRSEIYRPVRRVERGPRPNELLFYFDDRLEVVDDRTLDVVRRVAKNDRPGFSYSRDGTKTSWREGTTAFIRDEKTRVTVKIEAGEDPGRPVLSPDNKVVVIGDAVVDKTGGEGTGSVYLRIFNAATGQLIRKLTIVDGAYGALTPVFSPDGKTLAVGNRNYRTNLFDTSTWTLRKELPRSMTHEIAFSPDGKRLATAYVDGTIAIWDVETGELLKSVDSGCSRVQCLDWSPDGLLLATSGPKGTRGNRPMPGNVQLWDPKTLRLVRDLVDVKQSGSVRFTRDGKRLIARLKRDNLVDSTSIMVWSTTAPPLGARSNPVEPSTGLSGSVPAELIGN